MKRVFTTITSRGRHLIILASMFLSIGGTLRAQAPYCSCSHSITGCPTYNMYIGAVRVTQGTSVLFDKADDKCNQTAVPNYTMMSSTPSFTLSGGSNYTMWFTTGTSYNVHIGVWIDLNQDNDFSDNGEYISNGWSDITTGTTLQARNFTLSCNGIKAGNTRMRIRTDYYGSAAFSASSACATVNYGETEDYTIALAIPTSVSAGFYMPSSAYVGTPVKMTNANQSGYVGHQWDINDDGSNEYTSTNATHVFTSAGTKCIRLRSQNCLGRDSVLKCINIIAPTARPVVDFAANTNEVERYGTINFIDLSTNGPTYWSWYMYIPGPDSAASRLDVETFNSSVLVGNNPNVHANPAVFFNKTGTYTVCMQASNGIGPSSLTCKKNYVRITPFKDNVMGAGTVQPIYEAQGNIIDDGGRTANYSNNRVDYATIIPCGAKKITLTFKQFKVQTGDLLKIYDGPNALGKPLHPGVGFTAGSAPTGPIVATSGAMYLYYTTNGAGVDSGFIASWVTEKGTTIPPVASFTIPDTLYNPNTYTYVNTSENVLGKTDYVWRIDPGYDEVGYAKDLDFAILTDNTYDVTMTASTCAGDDTYTKQVVVVTPHSKAELDFKADNRRPSTGEEVIITPTRPTAGKAIQADQFKFTFFPGTVTVVSQDPYTGAIKVKFNAKGKYTVSMRGWNSLDSAATTNSVIKADFVIVVEHCTPLLGISPSQDMSINLVRLQDSKGKILIENTTATNTSTGYDDYTLNENISATVTYGATYTITANRFTTSNPMSRRVWIDYNIDGDFDDANELVASESTALTDNFTANFTIPTLANAFEGKTRMRIGTSYSTDPNLPCGASSGVNNANRLGEFEDYRIIMVNDNMPPTLTLNGADTVYLEVNTPFVDPGAVATDPTEGDISKNIVLTSDVDMNFTGVYYLQYNVKDASGNPAVPVGRVVYVVKDQTKPVITLNGNDTVRVEVYGTYTDDGASATDNKDGNITNAIATTGKVNTSVLGTYTITYAVSDVSGNSTSKNRIVIVRDSQKPVINNTDADANNTVKVQIVSIFVDRTKVTDNYDEPTMVITNGPGTVDGVDTRFKGTYTLVYNAMDGSGNKADTKVYKYIVEDYVGPSINLNTLDTVIWTVNKPYTPVQASTTDNYYSNSELSLTRTSNVNPFKLGLYWDEFTATDGSGNVTVRRRFVRVVDDVAPVINGSSLNVGLYSNIDAAQGLTITDNYDAPTSLIPRLVVLSNNLNTYVEGLYTVTFQVSDLSGNKSLPYERTIWVSRTFETQTGSVASLDLEKMINVYPNPTTGELNVSYNFATPETMEVQVFNATGSMVAEIGSVHGQNGVQTIDLSNEASGLYTVRMRINGRQVTRKVSVRR